MRSAKTFIALSALFLIILLSSFSSAFLLDSDYPEGRVAQWGFEDNFEDSIGNNDGTSHGAVTFTQGIIGSKGAHFDGSSFVEIPDDESLQFTDSMTIWGWIMPEEPTDPWAGIFSKGEAENDTYYRVSRVYISNTTKNQFRTRWQFTDEQNVQANSEDGFIEYPGMIYNFAVTYDGENVKLYIDGDLIETTPYTEDLSLEGSAYIGAFKPFFGTPNTSRWHFRGIIDEITLWDRALTDVEVRRLYEISTDNTAPAQITNLRETERSDSSIRWEWSNPIEEDFSHNIIFIDGVRVTEISGSSYEARGLDEDTEYTIEIRTEDVNNNVNDSGVMDTATTKEDRGDDDDDDDNNGRSYRVIDLEQNKPEIRPIVQNNGQDTVMLDTQKEESEGISLLIINIILLIALAAILLLILVILLVKAR